MSQTNTNLKFETPRLSSGYLQTDINLLIDNSWSVYQDSRVISLNGLHSLVQKGLSYLAFHFVLAQGIKNGSNLGL